eukprot:gene7993-12458_t
MAQILISGHEVVKSGLNKHVIYTIELLESNCTIKRRYKQFLQLHTKLSKDIPVKELPYFPPKLLSGNFQEEKIKKRKNALEVYLNGVVNLQKLGVRKTVIINIKKNPAMIEFFDVGSCKMDEELEPGVYEDEKNYGEVTSNEYDIETDEVYTVEENKFTFRSVPKLTIEIDEEEKRSSEISRVDSTENLVTPRTEELLKDSYSSPSDFTRQSGNDFSDYEDHPEILNLMKK